ncbi:hypothetical protein [Novosphingobium sp. PY1]|uniref:Uncharacterized protein n=1 Tax=Ochrobactrum sp. PW1 TaxID=1882222 RepID=A0A292GT22_9HYPH|nr:hypothetical protein [Novosphingobium sp. PY1]BBA74381.1 hypothetical protein [Ochrobactrum sp. PW1]GFM29230.1 uncharacterized protein PY1_contig-07-156 [Novosphingobium sp. PY1]
MSDKGIIFSAPMIRALLDGRKTQTRRLLTNARVFATPESRAFTLKKAELTRALQGADRWRHLGGTGWFWESDAFDYQSPATRTGWMAHLPYAPGDQLYVRENFQLLSFGDYLPTKQRPADVRFAATDPLADLSPEDRGYPWRPCIHMPRWASRMFLTVTDVRVQRLQEISEDDARAEGLTPVLKSMPPLQGCDGALRSREVFEWEKGWSVNAVPAFEALWNSLHTAEGERWEDNPWIVAVSFDVHHGNIDAEKAA